jgi:hypothetical protein
MASAAVPAQQDASAAPAPLPCVSADAFYTLEAPTLQLLFARVQHCASIRFVYQPQEAHPPCFAFRSKPNTTAAFTLPSSLHEGKHRQWSVVGNIGRGTYGHAILVQEAAAQGGGEGDRRVYKVDTARDSVVWEAAVHQQVCSLALIYPQLAYFSEWQMCVSLLYLQLNQRLDAVTGPHSATLRALYERCILAPTALLVYRSSAVLQMPYAQWGTLVTVLSVLVRNKNAFSSQEHEWLCAYLTLQVQRL